MKMTIESTTKMVKINGVPARVWEGTSARGIPVICFITRIAVEKGADSSEFAAELKEQKAPTPLAQAFDYRFFIDDDEQ